MKYEHVCILYRLTEHIQQRNTFRESSMTSSALLSLVISVSDSLLEIFLIQTLKIKLLWSEKAHEVC